MAATRLELNVMRLLSRCEALAAERRDPEEWRLEKYVAALEDMLRELKKQSSKPAPELLNEYSRKVDFLKGLLEAEKLSSSMEKALANQFLAPGRTPTTAKERTPATKTVHLQTKARCTGQMRSELLGTVCSIVLVVFSCPGWLCLRSVPGWVGSHVFISKSRASSGIHGHVIHVGSWEELI
uniref:Vesicle transport protein USE1 n=1 Tax=Corvus moneduloides TaxID=1196302 RepID=A0A8C3DCT8_CORMO